MTRRVRAAAGLGVLLAAAACGTTKKAAPLDGYALEIEAWRAKRVARLQSDTGWLTVAGLFWLEEGENAFGTDAGNAIVLPENSAPAHAGVFMHERGKTRVRVFPGTPLRCQGRAITEMPLRSDAQDTTDVLELNALRMFVIKRGARHGIRMRDLKSPQRTAFRGIESYPIDAAYRVPARFESYNPPKTILVPTILGTVDSMTCPGALVFTLQGQTLRLDPVLEDPAATELFLIFSDATTGEETYPGGRFLYADLPKAGATTLDFNKAYNPPCAFTAFATCPLPPPGNDLAVAVRAGEKTYGEHAPGAAR